MFYVYILKSEKDGNLYTGYTNNLKRRIEEHNSGKSTSTKLRKPFELIYYEAYKLREDATHREKMLKEHGRSLGGLKRRISKSLKS
ncbi:MAG: putative endonuclease [Parcubacteria group bacterium Gr01-1014_46]|nr:MAG: putative endonuclease [Parcubacteria group bacterium Gr01-1014_46]